MQLCQMSLFSVDEFSKILATSETIFAEYSYFSLDLRGKVFLKKCEIHWEGRGILLHVLGLGLYQNSNEAKETKSQPNDNYEVLKFCSSSKISRTTI